MEDVEVVVEDVAKAEEPRLAGNFSLVRVNAIRKNSWAGWCVPLPHSLERLQELKGTHCALLVTVQGL